MIKFSIHPSFFFLFFLALVHGFLMDVLLLFFIVLAHEGGHAAAAKYFGWRIRKVELLPYGGVAVVDEHGNRPLMEELIVVIAGPIINLLLIVASLPFFNFLVVNEEFLFQFIEYNLLLFLFNLLPILPLDGGKCLQILLCLFYPYKKAIRRSLLISVGCLCIYIVVVTVYFPLYFSLWIVALFLCTSQWLEYKQIPYQYLRFLMERYKQGDSRRRKMDVSSIYLTTNQLLYEGLEHLYRHKEHYYYVVSEKGKLTNVISEQEMLEHFFKYHHSNRAVGEIFR